MAFSPLTSHLSLPRAEREGFEPSIGVDPLCRFSKPVPSATRPPLQELRRARKLTLRRGWRIPGAALPQAKVHRPPALSMEKLRRLAGCLEMRSGDHLVEEQRMDLRAGSMLGMGRTTSSKGLLDHELTLIQQKAGKIVFQRRLRGPRARLSPDRGLPQVGPGFCTGVDRWDPGRQAPTDRVSLSRGWCPTPGRAR